jgi:hypothetical protein
MPLIFTQHVLLRACGLPEYSKFERFEPDANFEEKSHLLAVCDAWA